MRYSILKHFITFLFVFYISLNISTAQIQGVTADQLREWVFFLSSDQMQGRHNGSPEMKLAADWIAEKYEEVGLKYLDKIGGYIQNYTYKASQKEVKERNVIGFIEGSDTLLKDEFIILSAHFDHIGISIGSKPDSIFNGADDNAAGTATLIGIAKAINNSGVKPGRSIIFAAFSGEETGMKGSRYFVLNSPVPLHNIYADLNFEMTGHSEYLGKNRFYMTGCKISNLDNMAAQFNLNTEYELIDTIKLAESLFRFSDNISFSVISFADGISTGIPSGTFATTTNSSHIHNVNDEASLFDFENMAGLVNYFSKLVIWLSHSTMEVRFTDPLFRKIDLK